MKAIAVPLVATLAVIGFAGVQAPAAMAHTHSTSMKASHVTGEVVSTAGNKLVIKTASGEETFTVSGKAASELASFKAGDKVVVKAHEKEALAISPEGKAKSKGK